MPLHDIDNTTHCHVQWTVVCDIVLGFHVTTSPIVWHHEIGKGYMGNKLPTGAEIWPRLYLEHEYLCTK